MEKPASPLYPIQDLLRKRWSPRAFSPQAVPRDILNSLLEAARWAASSYNEQPWRYIIATKDQTDAFQTVLACLEPNNQKWAHAAPVLMLGIIRTTFTRNGKPNSVALHDLGAASAQLTLEATARGLAVHQMQGVLPEKIRATFHVPAEYQPVTALAIGYPGDPEQLPEALRKVEREPRTRKAPAELFFDAAKQPFIAGV